MTEYSTKPVVEGAGQAIHGETASEWKARAEKAEADLAEAIQNWLRNNVEAKTENFVLLNRALKAEAEQIEWRGRAITAERLSAGYKDQADHFDAEKRGSVTMTPKELGEWRASVLKEWQDRAEKAEAIVAAAQEWYAAGRATDRALTSASAQRLHEATKALRTALEGKP